MCIFLVFVWFVFKKCSSKTPFWCSLLVYVYWISLAWKTVSFHFYFGMKERIFGIFWSSFFPFYWWVMLNDSFFWSVKTKKNYASPTSMLWNHSLILKHIEKKPYSNSIDWSLLRYFINELQWSNYFDPISSSVYHFNHSMKLKKNPVDPIKIKAVKKNVVQWSKKKIESNKNEKPLLNSLFFASKPIFNTWATFNCYLCWMSIIKNAHEL